MNTPAHLIIGAAAFGRARQPWITVAAVLGSLTPDLSLYFMVAWNRWVRGMSAQQIFDVAYFSDYWQQVFAIDNSIPIWLLVLCVGAFLRVHTVVVFAMAGLLHLVLDFALHHDDGRAHFFPFSDWVFASPLSYWDSSAYGHIVGPLEAGLCAILLVVLWRRHGGWPARTLLVLVGLAELVPAIAFGILFSGG